ncbi:hypothetical protein AV530_009419 [Patagioenas fasciata monilis]|uniref:Uncharacterized protein n=1 Tax=Patagioenas fasciata monilis TaxID=372326 RepID=A0A1V4JIW3_PATFA|nr:hypothetical protein AV530_009419 [Patagioenas fasciata monilis]
MRATRCGSSPVRDGTARVDGTGREDSGSAPAQRGVGRTPAGPKVSSPVGGVHRVHLDYNCEHIYAKRRASLSHFELC